MTSFPKCVKCGSDFTYQVEAMYICPECGNEWTVENKEHSSQGAVIKDAYGNLLQNGDDVTIIKDVKVKGTSSVIKVGLKVKDIRLVDEVNGHNIDAKVPGFGSMMLKSEIVKKCN